MIAAQLREWPDSRIMSAREATIEWSIPPEFVAFAEWDKDSYHQLYGSESERKHWWSIKRMEARSEHYYRLLMAFGGILANGYQVVFYECGVPDEQGRRYRGARYGVEGSEYVSGFPGGKV